ncbi:MAG: WbqC family protein, partial [Bacteroidales bacterium]
MKPHILLSVAYLPPVEYFVLLSNGDVSIEKHEYYCKQSYRNRTILLTANGINQLSIPICHQQNKMLIKEVKIDYKTPWQRNHWKTIESAYNNSPFFLYYQDYIKPFYQKQYPYLFDFNMELINILLKLLKLDIPYRFTTEYRENIPNTIDARKIIHPKNAFFQN